MNWRVDLVVNRRGALGSLSLVLLGISLAGCARPAERGADGEALRAPIEARDRSLEQAELRGDAAALASHYATDAVIYGTDGGPDVRGREAIEASFRRLYADTRTEVAELQLEALEPVAEGVLETGRFTFQFRTAAGEVRCERGRYTVTWRLDADGEWRIVSDRSAYDPPGPPGPCVRGA